MRRLLLPWAPSLLLCATAWLGSCKDSPKKTLPDPRSQAPVDPTQPAAADQARLAQVAPGQEAALFGGISAEGAAGDYLLYNDRVRFVIRGGPPGNFYLQPPGSIIDIDVVRSPGEPGRDGIDEHTFMPTDKTMFYGEHFEILDSGRDGMAHLRVTGRDGPLQFLAGAYEDPDAYQGHGLRIVRDYQLAPGSWILQLDTRVENPTDVPVTITPGEILMLSGDIMAPWHPGSGFAPPEAAQRAFAGAVALDNGQSLLVFAREPFQAEPFDEVSAIFQSTGGFIEPVTIEPGASWSWTSWIGVAGDMATLEAARLAELEQARADITGVVRSAGSPAVAGAWVHLLAEGGPWTVAVTDAQGRFRASVPPGDYQVIATGDGNGYFPDLPAGYAHSSPYAAAPARALALASLTDPGAMELPVMAQGFPDGAPTPVSLAAGQPAEVALALPARAWLTVRVEDGGGEPLPARVAVSFADGDPTPPDPRLGPGNPLGRELIAYLRDGQARVPLAPGRYRVTASRGVRYEVAGADLDIAPGQDASLALVLHEAYEHPGWLIADPHVHAAPSGDTGIPMEARLVTLAACGVDIHVATDHDHVADYRPIRDALALQPWLQSVVGTESSTWLRGHFNLYPLEPDLTRVNGGAVRWWDMVPYTTPDLIARLRERGGPGAVLTTNHPWQSSGLFRAAEFGLDGSVGREDYWTTDYDALELVNRGELDDVWRYAFVLYNQGLRFASLGVSDAHQYEDHRLGQSRTLVYTGEDLADLTPSDLVAAIRAGRTVASYGPALLVQASTPGGGTGLPGSELVGDEITIQARVLAPSWLRVDTLEIHANGELVRRFSAGSGAKAPEWMKVGFTHRPERDTWYAVIAKGERAATVEPFAGLVPWAISTPIYLDLDGRGWQPPDAP